MRFLALRVVWILGVTPNFPLWDSKIKEKDYDNNNDREPPV